MPVSSLQFDGELAGRRLRSRQNQKPKRSKPCLAYWRALTLVSRPDEPASNLNHCVESTSASMLSRQGHLMFHAGHKLASAIALLALLLQGISSLAGALYAARLPVCCSAGYCPLHHHPRQNVAGDKKNCGGMNIPGQTDCSMQGCDTTLIQIASAAPFVLASPPSIRAAIVVENALVFPPRITASGFTVPLTPPPRPSLS
jgi:hypothetical protein